MELAVEMDDRLAGRWMDTSEDEEMQQEFRAIISRMRFEFGGPLKARLATTFLRRNRFLLD